MNEQKTTIHAVGESLGIKRTETDAILADIRQNMAKLDGCDRPHEFTICLDRRTKQPIAYPKPQQQFGADWACAKCGGRTSSLHRSWYNQGVKDGRAS